MEIRILGPLEIVDGQGSSAKLGGRKQRIVLAALIQDLNEQMLGAARELQFELAARIRDEISELKKELRAMDVAGVR